MLSSVRGDEVVNLGTKRVILSTSEDVDNSLENEGRVTSPGEEVGRVILARTSNDNTRLVNYIGVITLDFFGWCE